VSQLFPQSFVPVAMLPQSPGVDPRTCLPELVKCVEQYGCVGINLNPDPSGGHWKEPPLTDKWWYPIYEKMVEYDIPRWSTSAPAATRPSTPPARTT
jgi:4-oxalmesaconate hydratase